MRLGLNLFTFGDRSLPEALRAAEDLGVSAVEVPVPQGGPFVELEQDAWVGELVAAARSHGLAVSAIDNHLDSQLVLGPYGAETAFVHGGTEEERRAWASARVRRTIDAAAAAGVPLITGFFGEAPGSHWFPWPDPKAQERAFEAMKAHWSPLLDYAAQKEVRFAHEPHPRQTAFDLETCWMALEALDYHPAMGFNLDTANLLLSGVAPEVFVSEMGDRVLHLHAKDLEFPAPVRHRSGPHAGGPWTRPDRGWRFRMAGWGEVNWKGVISELVSAGFDGTLSIEHEDALFSREEGAAQAVAFLQPMLPRQGREEPWW